MWKGCVILCKGTQFIVFADAFHTLAYHVNDGPQYFIWVVVK